MTTYRLAAFLLTVSLAAPALAGDSWSTPFAGVRRLVRTTSGPNQRINALYVDLDMPGVSLAVTPYSLRRRTTSSLGRALKAQAAINGDFFNTSTYAVNGLAVARGVQYPGSRDDDWNGTLQFNRAVTRVEMSNASEIQRREAWMWGLVSGHPTLVQRGEVLDRTGGVCASRAPRTGVGLSANGRTLIMVVVDGRTSAATGMTCNEFGRLLKRLGAVSALNLDGGGSTDMWIAGKGVVNRPSDGHERVVANHLALFAKPVATLGVLRGTVTRASDGRPLAGVTVKIQTGKSVRTDAKGQWRLGLPSGNYRITFEKAGFTKQVLTRAVKAKKTTAFNVKLARPAGAGPQGIAEVEAEEAACAAGACLADADGDGVRDADDSCPAVANATQTDADDDGLGDACDEDADADGLEELADNCPLDANPEQADLDGDGTGDACDTGGAEAADDFCAEENCESIDPDSDQPAPDPGDETGGCASAPVGAFALAAALVLRRRRSFRA